MKWVEALKEYAKQKGKYVVPRKGSPEYDEVKKLMGMAHKDTAKGDIEAGQAKRDEKKAVAESAPEAKPKKPRAPRKKKAVEASVPSEVLGEGVRPEKVGRAKRGKKVEAEKMMIQKSEGKTVLAAEKTKNPEAILQVATNTHEPIAPPAALAGNLAELKKDMAKVRKPRALPVLVEKERVENAVPFSFVEFKRKLGE